MEDPQLVLGGSAEELAWRNPAQFWMKDRPMPASLPPGSTGDRRNHSQRQFLLDRVAGEFREMPCLRLTRAQAQRLFGLRADVCDRILIR